MEASMKTMSWSRYHCLSFSLLRAARRQRAGKNHGSRRRHHAPQGAGIAPRLPPGVSGPLKAFQSAMRSFRAAWQGDTDV
jgi:hypothetical protein